MIDSENLRAASLYINNQLLSRGLLRDGQDIDFASPGENDGELAETMSRIISVLNDLILRRDREAEHRESLSAALRTLRAESLRQTSDIQQLQEKHADAQRRVHLSEAAEASLRAQLQAAEAAVHRLKEEATRTKVLVAQTRAACATETRKRDRQVDALKKAVADAGRARGAARNPGITTITVSGDPGSGSSTGGGLARGRPHGATADDGYDLQTETNGFLAELAKSLSGENEGLAGLLRRTSSRLREMSGWDREEEGGAGAMSDGHAVRLPVGPEELAGEIDPVLDHLRTILTNPSFVPIEEVVMREEEIARLRRGWDKMESRWREAVHLIDGWRRRMQTDGHPVDVEELEMGLRLSPVRVRDVEETSSALGLRLPALQEEEEEEEEENEDDNEGEVEGEEEVEEADVVEPRVAQLSGISDGSLGLVSAGDYEGQDFTNPEPRIPDRDVKVHLFEGEEPSIRIVERSTPSESSPLPSPPQLSPLRDSHSAGNRGASLPTKRNWPGDFATIKEDQTRELAQGISLPPPEPSKPQAVEKRKRALEQEQQTRSEKTREQKQQKGVPPPPVDLPTPNDSSPRDTLPAKAENTAPKASAASKTTTGSRSRSPTRVTSRPQSRPAPTPMASRRPARKPSRPANTVSRQPIKPHAETSSQDKSPARPSRKPNAAAPSSATANSNSRDGSNGIASSSGHTSKDRAASKSTASAASTASAITDSPSASSSSSSSSLPADARDPAQTLSATYSPRRGGANSRLPLRRPGCGPLFPGPQQSPALTTATIAAKLAASEREADAARVRAKLRAARLGGRRPAAASAPEQGEAAEEGEGGRKAGEEEVEAGAGGGDGGGDGGGGAGKKRKRERRAGKAASRRRSTLNPRELESLINGSVEER